MQKAQRNSCGCPEPGHLDTCCYSNNHGKGKPSYTAANEQSPFTGLWNPENRSAAYAYEDEREPISGKVLDIYRNHGQAQGIVELVVEHLTSKWTISPQPNIKALDGWDDEDKSEWIDNVLCWYRDYLLSTKQLDAREKQDFRGMVEMAARMRKLYGEITGVVKVLDPEQRGNKHREFSTAIQLINPGRIYTPSIGLIKIPKGHRVVDGLHEDQHGRLVKAYVHRDLPDECSAVSIYEDDFKPTIVRKYGVNGFEHREQFIHIFKQKEVDGVRGVSDFAATAEAMWMQRELDRQILARAISQNKRIGVIKSNRHTAAEAGKKFGLNTGQTQIEQLGEYSAIPNIHKLIAGGCSKEFLDQKLAEVRYEKQNARSALQGAQYLKLHLGDEFDLLAHDNGTLAASDLHKSLDRFNSAAHSVSTNTINRDYTDGNYSGQRAGRNDFEAYLQTEKRCIDEFASIAYRLVGEECIINGMLPLPKRVISRFGLNTPKARENYYRENRRALMGVNWRGPAHRLIDANQDVKGLLAKEEAGYATYAENVEQMTGEAIDAFLESQEESDRKRCDSKLRSEAYEHQKRQDMIARNELPAEPEIDETEE